MFFHTRGEDEEGEVEEEEGEVERPFSRQSVQACAPADF